MARPFIVFVTGKLATGALEPIVRRLADSLDFDFQIITAKISVAALITPDWLIGKLQIPPGATRIILPGLCSGPLENLQRHVGEIPIERGPKDLRELPDYFRQPRAAETYGASDIEILAEINNADRLSIAELIAQADGYRDSGADRIDLGCSPGATWTEIADAVRELKSRGFRLSVDSFNAFEVAAATRAGAELVLSVNNSNAEAARDWGAEVVAIPDNAGEPDWLDNLKRTVERLEKDGVRYRLDPILEPIGFGFAKSIQRYLQTREAFPDSEMLMGIGNLTEMTEVDSAGVNALLIGICQEQGIRSVLTTEVIHWAKSCVAEVAAARQLMKYAVDQGVVPKKIDHRLVMLRGQKPLESGDEELHRLQSLVTDRNFRLFVERGRFFAFNAERFEEDADPFDLFERLGVTDASHAFYLGWEMMKAATAIQLGKRYVQDQALDWGLLTREEISHRAKKNKPESES